MMVIPCLGSQSLLKSSSMPGADFSNSQEFPEADGMAFVQNLGQRIDAFDAGEDS